MMKQMNKTGGLLLRDFIFVIVVGSSILLLCGLFVQDIGDRYDNTNMTGEWDDSGLSTMSSSSFSQMKTNVSTMKNATDSGGLIGSVENIFGVGILKGAAQVFMTIFGAPAIISNALQVMVVAIGVPAAITEIVINGIQVIVYGVLIFAILTALLKGGKV